MDNLNLWLLDGPAWVQYRTRRDLLRQSEDKAEVIDARKAMIEDPLIEIQSNSAQAQGLRWANQSVRFRPLRLRAGAGFVLICRRQRMASPNG